MASLLKRFRKRNRSHRCKGKHPTHRVGGRFRFVRGVCDNWVYKGAATCSAGHEQK